MPQGTILGPILFIIYINDISTDLTSTVKIYADDTKVYRTISSPDVDIIKRSIGTYLHNYRTRSVSSESFYVKFSRTDKMYAFFSRISAQIWNSIPYSIKLLKRSSFRKKIKELLLNFLRSEDDYVEVSGLIKLL